ncbi:glycosyltransferase family 4 protein [Gracilimonas mengyeensis]|uniref:Glycosyl transferase family 1 domain-containing protein n=1 Tax=Gracilimonas mengyeensis TaxID=1302730 RepID=A0A521EI18_9BACT|nr:glycosyltransferase family 4 protein [Gracilimonas mengyeensis]SMO83121.1 hypothetical protein SAMN06265219_11239 [Gracilimonas mengyeensis]
MARKVLLIAYYWPPSGGAGVQRWVKFCKYLPEFGIEPVVLTVANGTYPMLDESLADELPADLEVHQAKSIEPYTIFGKLTGKTDKQVSTPSTAFSTDGGWMQKLGVWVRSNFFIPDARIGWIPGAFSKAKDIITNQKIDTVITTGPPNSTHVIGKKLKNWRPGVQWIMDMRDPWSQIFYNETLPRTSLAQHIDENMELKALKTADDVIVVSNSMAELEKNIYKRYYHVISNGFDHEDFPESHKKNTKESNTFTIRYVGSMTEPAIPHQFFKALASLNNQQKAMLNIEFFGSYNSKVHKAIADNELEALISFKGYVPHQEATEAMQSANLLLLVIPDTKDNELILTGKLFDYLAAQTPILFIGPKQGDAAHIIRNYKLGRCFDYAEFEAMGDFLEGALHGNDIPYKKWKGDFKSHPYSRYQLTSRLAQILDQP